MRKAIAALAGAALVAALGWPTPAASQQKRAPVEPGPPIATLHVHADRDIEVVDGPADSPRVLLYLHGVCGNPYAFRPWRAAAAKHGTLISLRGDEGCDDKPGRSKWSYDFDKNNRRVSEAIARADAWRQDHGEAHLDGEHVVVIGYSQGSRRAEWFASRFPERYRHVGLIAGAYAPAPEHLANAQGVLVMAGQLDAKKHLIEGEDALEKAGIRARYLELPNAGHGEYGPQALRVMGEGLDWLLKEVP